MLPHPVLVADIGGTNCRVALVMTPGAAPLPVARLSTDDAATAQAALEQAIALCPDRPRSAALAVAGPIVGQTAELTNAGWRFDGSALAQALGLEQGLLVNDFEALAAALDVLQPRDLEPIRAGEGAVDGARLVLGPGTGFGAAALVGRKGRRAIVATEAGHMEIGPVEPDEFALWPHLERVDGRVTIEALLSGAGLARLDAALRAAAGARPLHASGAAVQAAAAAGEAHAVGSVTLFGRLLARTAGDLALACKATGGVLIAGGIAPRLLPLWNKAMLAHVFAHKPPMGALMAGVPLSAITAPDPAERGLARLALDPSEFGLSHRLWLQG